MTAHIKRSRTAAGHLFEIYSKGVLAGHIMIMGNGLIKNFLISPKYRNQGLGKMLFTAAVNKTSDLPLFLIANALDDIIPQDKLEAFYMSHGFVPVGPSGNGTKMVRADISDFSTVCRSMPVLSQWKRLTSTHRKG